MGTTDAQDAAVTPVRVFLVESQCLFRQALRLIIDRNPCFHVVGEASDGAEAVVAAAEFRPDVLISAPLLPGVSGIEAARMIRRRVPEVKVLLFSTPEEGVETSAGFEAGVDAYVSKNVDQREFLRIVYAVAKGKSLDSPFLLTPGCRPALPLPKLTDRERDIYKYLSRALSNKEIASELGISPETVKARLQHIYAKLGVRNRTEAVQRFANGPS